MAGELSTNAPIGARASGFSANTFVRTRAAVFSANGAPHASPGQRPGSASSFHPALKGRPNRCLAPSGLEMFLTIEPRALPWAGVDRPFGASPRHAQFAESANLEQAIKANLRGLGYGG